MSLGAPWFNAQKQAWYIKVSGKLVSIKRPDGTLIKGQENEAEAVEAWHKMMAVAQAPQNGDDNPLYIVLDLYMQDLERRHGSAKTLKEYKKYYQEFCDANPGLTVGQFKPIHLLRFFDAHSGWSDGMRNYIGTAFQSALNWAAGADGSLISKNPLKGMRMPQGRSRGAQALVSDDDHRKLLEVVPEDLRQVLTVLRAVGCRPSAVYRVTAAEFYPDQGVWRFEASSHKTGKKTRKPLVVPLPDHVVTLCSKLVSQFPEGPLFRTARGGTWDAQKLANRIAWYKNRHKLNVIAYGYRHTVATELLEAGVEDAKVAAILGHKNTAMIYRHYGHLGTKIKSLRDLLQDNAGFNHVESAGQKQARAQGTDDGPATQQHAG